MGLQQYKRTQWHDDALLVVGAMRLYRGKIFARWVYNNTNARNDMMMRCLLSEPDPEIPDSGFIVYTSKRRFVPVCASLNRGFRGLVGAMRLYRGKIFARWVYNNTNAQSTESPILFRSFEHETQFSDQNDASKIGDSVLCKRTQWHDDALLVVGPMRLYRGKIFASYFTKEQSIKPHYSNASPCHLMRVGL